MTIKICFVFLYLSCVSGWPSCLRRQTQGIPFSLGEGWVFWSTNVGVGSNPTSDRFFFFFYNYCSNLQGFFFFFCILPLHYRCFIFNINLKVFLAFWYDIIKSNSLWKTFLLFLLFVFILCTYFMKRKFRFVQSLF